MTRPPILRLHADELIVDSFAGGGGASLGIEMALGRSPDIAINHDPEAIALHAANHPETRHYCESVWDVSPRKATGGRPVGVAWFSPDCKHFSKAKGGKPVSKNIRGLAWVVIRWARDVRPRVILLENVEEFQSWGPLLEDGRPCPLQRGFTFRRWLAELRGLGYHVEYRERRSCFDGAPTTRKRLYLIARCDGQPIVWPEPHFGPARPEPYRVAAGCIDWSIPCPSIFDRPRPLAENTLRRIARGIQRFVIDAREPFIVPEGYAPTMVQVSWGEREGQAPRCLDLHRPLGTIVAGGIKHAVVAAFLAKHYGGNETPGSSLARPMDTITTQDHHALVRAFLVKYYGTGEASDLAAPLGTVTTHDRFGLVTVAGERYTVADIGMRMLTPRELYRAQGFPDTYRIEIPYNGKPLSKTAQVRMCGNSVSPPTAAALVRAQFEEAAAPAAWFPPTHVRVQQLSLFDALRA